MLNWNEIINSLSDLPHTDEVCSVLAIANLYNCNNHDLIKAKQILESLNSSSPLIKANLRVILQLTSIPINQLIKFYSFIYNKRESKISSISFEPFFSGMIFVIFFGGGLCGDCGVFAGGALISIRLLFLSIPVLLCSSSI